LKNRIITLKKNHIPMGLDERGGRKRDLKKLENTNEVLSLSEKISRLHREKKHIPLES